MDVSLDEEFEVHEGTHQSETINELEDPAIPARSLPLVIACFTEM